ncbi:MAG: 4-hydroxy-3-methylbut-2-enyl diphosphate reductase [Candidatus Ornithospirochaeta sp.]
MKVVLAPYLGFCRGVEKAIVKAEETVSSAPEGKKIFFYGDIVHNTFVVDYFRNRGVEVISSLSSVTSGTILVVRAHGIPDKERREAEGRGAEIVDCTCPVVLRGQNLVRTSPLPVVVLGYKGHSEVVSLCGAGSGDVYVAGDTADLEAIPRGKYRGVVQTTFSLSAVKSIIEKGKEKGIEIELSNSICMASVQRRRGVEKIAGEVDAVVVVGASHSANAKELVETARKKGKPAYLVTSSDTVPEEVFDYNIIGLTAGASTPEDQYMKVKERLEKHIR